MCKGLDCKLKNNCYRYKAPINKFNQKYFLSPPFEKDGTCKYFYDIKEIDGE